MGANKIFKDFRMNNKLEDKGTGWVWLRPWLKWLRSFHMPFKCAYPFYIKDKCNRKTLSYYLYIGGYIRPRSDVQGVVELHRKPEIGPTGRRRLTPLLDRVEEEYKKNLAEKGASAEQEVSRYKVREAEKLRAIADALDAPVDLGDDE
jgi:hypothetical protein